MPHGQTGQPREWMPKIWLGGEVRGWLRLLRQDRYAVAPRYLPWAALISLHTAYNTLLSALQERLWGRRIRDTEIVLDPVFILGHWRSGTTWLHELLTLDPRHTYATTYACIFPGHFLLTERYSPRWLRYVTPSRRPMDNMAFAWERPQEDEFALCNLGQPSPYLTFAFPNHAPQYTEYFDLETVPPEARQRWQRAFLHFLKQLTLRRPQRLVLKSPTHTYRIRMLLELFPRARFVHIVRNPYAVMPSTIHTWRTLCRVFGLQRPTFAGLEQQVFHNYLHMFHKLEETRGLVEPWRLYELRYEDLVQDPIGQVRAIYDQLKLGDVTPILPRLQQYVADTARYQTNHYTLPPVLRDAIRQCAGQVIQHYDYG
jgi:hypothetical protein